MSEFNWRAIIKEHKTLIVLILLSLGLGIFSLVFSPGSVKKKQGKDYVYIKETHFDANQKIESNLPVINLKGKAARELNKTLKDLYQNENVLLICGFQIYDKYLSFVYWIITLHEDTTPTLDMKTAVFYLPNQRLVSTEELLKKYEITEEEAFQKMDEKMQFYYYAILKKGYIERNECDYACFLSDRQLSDDYKLQLFIDKDGVLTSYRAFNIYSFYDEHLYFNQDSFRFELAVLKEKEVEES